MISGEREPGVVITLHPKMVDRWARKYISIYVDEGPVFAKRWASTFLTEECRAAMSTRVRELGKKKGGPKAPD